MTHAESWRPRVVVCGTGFGRTYLAALRRPGVPLELAGILARGSKRSLACAEYYQVPLYTDVSELPGDIDVGCVVVDGALNGGHGGELAVALMARGIHVLQEHPLHHSELAACLRQARRSGVVYHLNTHYPHVPAISTFIGAARRLLERQPALIIDALTTFTVLYPLVDVIGQVIGGIRPWSLSVGPPGAGGFGSADGTIAGVPVALRIQNELHSADRDNGAHVLHRITLGTQGGNLLLVNTQGPVLWSPRLHMPADYKDAVTPQQSAAEHLDLPGTSCLTAPAAPSCRAMLSDDWPDAAGQALAGLRLAIIEGEDPLPRGQYHLGLCQIVSHITGLLGRPSPPALASGDAIVEADRLVRCQPA
jgi:pyochelin biosynthetic protein PchG